MQNRSSTESDLKKSPAYRATERACADIITTTEATKRRFSFTGTVPTLLYAFPFRENTLPQKDTIFSLKAKYGNWISIDDIPEITQYGRYSLRANGSDIVDHLAYRIPTQNPFEFIIAEYRNKIN